MVEANKKEEKKVNRSYKFLFGPFVKNIGIHTQVLEMPERKVVYEFVEFTERMAVIKAARWVEETTGLKGNFKKRKS